MAATGIVAAAGKKTERLCPTERTIRRYSWSAIAKVIALFCFGDIAGRRPVSFLRRGGNDGSWSNAKTIRIPQTASQISELLASGREPPNAFVGGQEIKIAGFIGFQASGVIVPTRRRGKLIRETFVMIGLAIVIRITQSRDLIATKHIELVVFSHQTQRLKQARGIATPRELFERGINTAYDPHIAMHGTQN